MLSPRENPMELPNGAEIQRSIDEMRSLLSGSTREADWQTFFESRPYVLTQAMGIQATGLFSRIPLLSGTPDFIYRYKIGDYNNYGVIELKRPDHSLTGVYSSKHLVPSHSLITAETQASRYLESIRAGNFLRPTDYFVAGTRSLAFIVMGRSEELVKRFQHDLFRSQFQKLLPMGFHLYTYDEILELFSKTAMAPRMILVSVTPTYQYVGAFAGFKFRPSTPPPETHLLVRWKGKRYSTYYGSASGYKSYVGLEKIHGNEYLKNLIYIDMTKGAPSHISGWEKVKGKLIESIWHFAYAPIEQHIETNCNLGGETNSVGTKPLNFSSTSEWKQQLSSKENEISEAIEDRKSSLILYD